MQSHVHLLFTLEGSTSTLHTSTLPWSGSKFTMSFPIRYDRSRGDDRVFFITTAAWTAFGKTCVTLLLNRFLHLDLVTVTQSGNETELQNTKVIVFFHSITLLNMHSMVTAKQYARHQGQFPNMGGVIYEIWHSSSSLIGSRHSSSESVPNSPSDKPYLFLAFSFPLREQLLKWKACKKRF